ncbi:TOBE domain-containing protein [Halarcobacter anaerophilus]|uniref:Molybdenum-binding protein n=1 Tax=Halarcobacter anaerophilus TaxID=877500 RepID=A0A4Q0Y407_9BACT|nr:TOBE domain-containing protein [Halarcobacter anaerophilus]QDF27592.1 transcriptional regulator, ModE family [Halarcobacter anaerophilus]RXJ63944.1 molybdenum-binding protein [Halarcobacter anaerophilus]
MEISSNLTLELFEQPFLLEKRIDLLFAVQKCGSINKAAKEVPMSYKKAWEAINAMNNLSSTPVVQTETGGKGGGGTSLTEYGENLLKTYVVLKKEQKKFLNNLKNMTDIDTGTLKTIGRLAMQISARNQISGVVEYINEGKVNAEVYIKLKSGYTLVSTITKVAAHNLDLKLGDEATAIFKSSTVLLTTDFTLNISARNKFQGTIEQIHVGEVNSEIVIDIGGSDKIASVITSSSIKNLELKEGSKVSAVIKASDIIVGK